MFFRQHKIYENKLSEQISDDNPYKQKLMYLLFITIVILFGVLSYVTYQFNIALFLVFFVIPILINTKYSKLLTLNRNLTLIAFWILLNTFLISRYANAPVNSSFLYVNILNTLLIAWINFLYCICFFYNMSKVSKKIISLKTLYSILFLCSFETICFWESKFSNHLFSFIIIGVISAFLYTYLLMQIFSKKECLYINLIVSLSPIITVICAFVSIFLILKTFNVQKDFRPAYLYGLYYLIFFQIISLSSIVFYFIPSSKFKNKNKTIKFISIIILLILISIGVIIQTQYGRFFHF